MSLLDRGNEEITVYPEVETTDERDNDVRVPSPDGVVVRCRVQPIRSDDVAVAGQQVTTVYKIIARDAPLGAWALVNWQGRDWDLIGEPLWSNGSPATRHVTVLITAREA